ncbi:MAG: hypothetical protein ACJZ8H_03020 [Paracoccaceae bacterium]
MSLKTVGMHESTVSRVTAGLLMNTPRGTFYIENHFFSVSIQSNSNGVGNICSSRKTYDLKDDTG